MLALPPRRVDRMDPPEQSTFEHFSHHGQIPRQFAIPAQTEAVGLSRGQRGNLSYTEHLRRRKTPNGPVLDDYDITPTDKSVHIPAAKHVLVSPSTAKSSQSDYVHSLGFPKRPTLNEPNYSRTEVGTDHGGHSQNQNYPRSEYPPAWNFPGGLDSVLNQTLPTHPSQRYYLHYGSTIPTVLPATMHAYLGPTASAGPELYGPYWPDGTFSPYRPAPVRDDRFYERFSTQQTHDYHTGRPIHELHHPLASYTPMQPVNGNGREASIRRGDSLRSFGVRAAENLPPRDSLFGHNNMGSHLPQWSGTLPDHNTQPHSAHPPFQTTPVSGQLDFRDKTFAWAHRVYVELLARVHKARKTSPVQYKFSGHSLNGSKPLIYPRPPKRPVAHITASLGRERTTTKGFGPPQPRHSSLHTASEEDELSRPPTAIFSPTRRGSESADGPWSATLSTGRVQSFSDHFVDKTRSARRVSDSLSAQYLTAQRSDDLQYNAVTALEIIEALCNEANGEWVDGMLLAGCLAYGLEDYNTALKWYQEILRRDKGHVEAMSNLAATLLALDRRQEALGYWAAAVKQRPSYFEAVEHLIGLLCGDQRAKEAVAIIESVDHSLRLPPRENKGAHTEPLSDTESETLSRSSSINTVESLEAAHFDHDPEDFRSSLPSSTDQPPPGYGSAGFAIPGTDNGRMLALIHAKGNMLYSLGDNQGAALAFEDAILVATGHRQRGIRHLIRRILSACSYENAQIGAVANSSNEPILLSPERALLTAKRMFYPSGDLPGLMYVAKGMAQKAAISTTSNSLLSLAKIYQDGLSNAVTSNGLKASAGTRDILALYYLSLSLQPSPSTANNVGILLASVQQTLPPRHHVEATPREILNIAGVVPGSGIALALAYYNFGLNLDKNHAHLYTNLGSLLKDIGQLETAISMYERAVKCDPNFDIALANLANAVKDRGQVADAISYYRRAVQANPDFAEAVCGLATALNSICGWHGRGGVIADSGKRDRIHVSEDGMMFQGKVSSGWISRVVEIVEKQLRDGEIWGIGTLTPTTIDTICQQLSVVRDEPNDTFKRNLKQSLQVWAGHRWEGSRVVRLIERSIQQIGWQWYQDQYVRGKKYPTAKYARPTLPSSMTSPTAPTVLPFHTFTAPLSAKQIRQISQRNGLRISASTLRSTWLPATVYPPPSPPRPHLNVGYVSSDFNNHPLAHLMQSIFGLHNPERVRAICYATTKSDGSTHRLQIEREAPVFYDASSWTIEKLVNQVVKDGVHILVNLNGYTRGARNEVFAARPAPIHMSFMGFAGTLGAEWCDYIYTDSISVPPETLSHQRRNVDITDRLTADALAEDDPDWVYSENMIYSKSTFFCVDHKQSAPDAKDGPPPLHDRRLRDQAWKGEQDRRWRLRKELFPGLNDNVVILGNFNQLYKIDPSIFRVYLRILSKVPNAILWLLRFPDLGEANLLSFAREWAGNEIASRIVFTDVAPKGTHITRASVVDLFLDTPECNAHTTAADVVWSGTPILTWGKWRYKMCSRMAGSIVSSAFPEDKDGDEARRDLVVGSEESYEEHAVELGRGLRYMMDGRGRGRLVELRRMLWEGRWGSRLFDTRRWVGDVERAYWEAWRRWERGQGGDIWL